MSIPEMSLAGSAMILCILLLRSLTRGRLPAPMLSAMWAAALLRLLVPVAIPSPLSFLGAIRQAGQATVPYLPARPVSYLAPLPPLVFVWLAGVALCALFFLLSGFRQRRVLQAALPAPMTPELKAALAAQRLSRQVAVYTSDRISTPLTYGLLRPRILLPSHMAFSAEELGFVLAHECGHIRRADTLKKGFLLAAVCLHWFNPLVWLMAAKCRRDMELNCDRHVLEKCGSEVRAAYARTLLDLEERKRFSKVLASYFSVSPLEERILTIMTGKKTTWTGALAAIAAFACAAAVFATSPGTQAALSVSTVWLSSKPIAAYDTRQIQASGVAVYAMEGAVPAFGRTGIELAAPAILTPVYSMTVTVKDSGMQP